MMQARTTRPGWPIWVVCVACVLLAAGCAARAPGNLDFTENVTENVTERRGFVDVTERSGLAGHNHSVVGTFEGDLVEWAIVSGGVAAGDYDDSGYTDLFMIGGNGSYNYLFENQGDGTFIERAFDANLVGIGLLGSAPLFADFNGNGLLDLFHSTVFSGGAYLYHNQGDGTFERVQDGAGIDNPLPTLSTTMGDATGDGALDLFLTRWLLFDEGWDRPRYLWENDGTGRFSDITKASGILDMEIENLITANFADLRGNGPMDLLLAGDFGHSHVLLHDLERLGTYSDVTDRDVITDENGMGAALGDVTGNGEIDWLVTSIYTEEEPCETCHWAMSGNRLYEGQGDGTFIDITDKAGVREGYWGWAACAQDFDNDTLLDLFHVNGFGVHGTDNPRFGRQFLEDPPLLFLSDGDGTFTESAAEMGITYGGKGLGAVCFDYNRDGRIDIFIMHNQGPAVLYENAMDQNNYLSVALRQDPSISPNTQAIGARVTIEACGKEQFRDIRAGSNYMSQDPAEAHFGLGECSVVDEVRVRWPWTAENDVGEFDESVFAAVEADQHLTISREHGIR